MIPRFGNVSGDRGSGGPPWGKMMLAAAVGVAAWARLPEDRKTSIMRGTGALLTAIAQYERERRLEEAELLRLRSVVGTLLEPSRPLAIAASPSAPVAVAASPKTPEPDPTSEWLRVIPHPSNVVVLGAKGSGKSACGYFLSETSRYRASPYVVGLPLAFQHLVPSWIGHAPAIEDAPLDSTVLVDEAYIQHHARESSSASAVQLSKAVNLSRQRGQTLIFISQEGRQLDRSIVAGADVIVFKDPGMLQALSDRPELRALAAEAKKAFDQVVGDRRTWAFVFAPAQGFKGLLRCPLPSFWTPELSRAYAASLDLGEGSEPVPVSLEDRIEMACRLRAGSRSYGAIGQIMGVSRATAFNYVNGYPYRGQRGDSA